MNGRKTLVALLVFSLLGSAGLAEKAAAEDWDSGFVVRLRGIGVVPDESSSVSPIGGKVGLDNAIVPELDISYFFTENLALELILATSQHDAKVTSSTLGNVKLGDFWLLPPTLLAQYHLPLGKHFKPYVGAGVNYSITYGEDEKDVAKFRLGNGLGWALQAGLDYMINDRWFLNADVKKIWVNVDGEVNGGAIDADIDVDPWIFGIGFGYRF